jgi:hypothetical protein
MIAKGSSGLKAYVGSTEVSKMYKGDVLVYSSTPPPPPYDAEVEWLGNSGTEYIQLPLSVPKNTYLCLDFVMLVNRDSSRTTKNRYDLFGASPAAQMRTYFYSYTSSTERFLFASSVGGVTTGGGWGFYDAKKTTVKFSTEGIWSSDVDGVISNNVLARPLTAAITAFRIFRGYQNTYQYPVKYYSFKITVGDNVVYDLIPVRKDGVGYMYDKIGGGMYGNVGTGSFTYGSDVV